MSPVTPWTILKYLKTCRTYQLLLEGKAKIAGIVTSVKSGVKTVAHGIFATVEDYTGQIGVLVFDKPLKTGQAYMFQGENQVGREDSYKLFAYKANALRRKSA